MEREPGTAGDPLARGFLIAALLLAALRFVALGRWSLWLDEALTLADAPDAWSHVNPFGYWFFQHVYDLQPARPNEFWLRFPAALFGAATVLAALWALRPLFGPRASALAAFFLASSAWHLYWAQSARFYTLAQFLALVGGGLLLRGLFRGSTWRTVFGLGLLALGCLTHPSTALFFAPLLLCPWIARWLEWIPSEATRSRSWSLLATAGWVVFLAGSGWALKAWTTWEHRQGDGDPLHFAKTAGYLVTPTVGLAFLLGVRLHWRRPESVVPVAATLLALGAAALSSFAVRVSAQYVFTLQPWIAAGAGLAFLPRPGVVESPGTRGRRALLALVVALPGLVESGLYFGVRHGDRPRWREAYAYVFEHRGPNDLVLGMDAPVAEYYLDPDARDLRDWKAVAWLDDFRSRLAQDWARYGRRTWYVVNATQLDDWTELPASAENRAEFERILREECTLAARFPVPLTPRDLDVLVYVTRAP